MFSGIENKKRKGAVVKLKTTVGSKELKVIQVLRIFITVHMLLYTSRSTF